MSICHRGEEKEERRKKVSFDDDCDYENAWRLVIRKRLRKLQSTFETKVVSRRAKEIYETTLHLSTSHYSLCISCEDMALSTDQT